ncbi:MAG: MotA/TolQ/ExbB proton channel family protein [Planctomycetaceae bacterium]|nr:MotA/TolQ/ExbB proton channel family protein [Planctomycetaceae bacterium]
MLASGLLIRWFTKSPCCPLWGLVVAVVMLLGPAIAQARGAALLPLTRSLPVGEVLAQPLTVVSWQEIELGPTTATEDPVTAPAAEANAGEPTAPQRSMLQMMFTGNPFGIAIVVLILVLSLVSCILIVENAISIRRGRLLPPDVMQALESALALRDTRAALMICNDIDNHSMATQVVQAGLERFRSSEFGFAEYRSAVEEAGEHITGRLYRKVEILNVIASIAPMLGLTGTVIGMIDAFNTIAAKQGVAGPEDLAGGIGQALITTLLGLVVAIPTMVAFSYFRTRIDALVSEAGTRIERMMLPLGRRKSSS